MYLFTFPIYIFIQYTFQFATLSPFHITQSLILNSFSSTQGEWGPPEYPPNMTSQVSATEVRLGSQVRGTGWTDRQHLTGHPLTLLVSGPMWRLKHIYCIYGRVLAHPVFALFWWVTFWESPSVQVSWLARSSNRLPVLLQALNPFPQHFQKTPWALFDDRLWVSASFSQVLDGDSQRTVMLSYCLQV